jgi:hypothetical protein
VTVVNTTPIPVNVGNTSPVPVNIGNTTPVPVNIQSVFGGAIPVTITSNPTAPPSTVSIGNPAALAAANAQALAPALGVGTPVVVVLSLVGQTYSVPVGQRFVIEYGSGLCQPRPSGSPNAGLIDLPFVAVITNGARANHAFAIPIAPPNVFPGTTFGNLIKIYADAGTFITNESNCVLTLSGQLVSP